MSDAPKASPDDVPPAAAPRARSGPAAAKPSPSGEYTQTERMQPPKTSTPVEGPLSSRLKHGAADTALNAAGILRDLWDDFRNSDQYFKYKALILACWVVLSVAGVVVAWPEGTAPTNNLGARLVKSKVLDDTVVTLFNESGEPWRDVTVIVDDRYRAAVGKVSAEYPDNTLTLEARKLLGEQGETAPSNIFERARRLEVRTREGRAELIVDGKLQ